MKRTLSLFLAAVLAFGLLAGCGRPGDVYKKGGTAAPAPQPATLKVGLVPGVESLPLWIAEQNGYFTQVALTVQLVNFDSAEQRNAALANGSIDGMIGDLADAVATIGAGAKARIVAAVMGATPEENPAVLLAGKGSAITAVGGLKGQQVSILPGHGPRFAAEQLLAEHGLKPADVTFVTVKSPTALLNGLSAGEIKAGLLPEPFATLAGATGATALASEKTAKGNYTQSVIAFSEQAVKGQGPAITRFFGAHNLAVADLRVKHQPHLDLLGAKANIPVGFQIAYAQKFPVATTHKPAEADVERVSKWLTDSQVLKAKVAYAQVVDNSLLPAAAQ